MGSALFWDITQPIVVMPYRSFGTDCPKTSARNYYYTRRNIAGYCKYLITFCCLFYPINALGYSTLMRR